jgi:hypothetical protein
MFRGDPRGMTMGFSTSQFISLILIPLALVMLLGLWRWTAEPAAAVQASAPRRKRKH